MKKHVILVLCICLALAVVCAVAAYALETSSDVSDSDGASTSAEQDREADASQNISAEPKEADYSVISRDGEHFIVFDDITRYQDGMQDGCILYSGVEFPSIKAFKDTVTQGKLDDKQKRIIATVFEKDDRGTVLSCDFNNLYEPKLPAAGSIRSVLWSGTSYAFVLKLNNGVSGSLSYLTESDYDSYQDLFSGKNKKTTYYSNSAGDFMNVKYSLSADGKTFVVDKLYRLRMNNTETKTSSDVPSHIRLYCSEGDEKYTINLYNFTEDPTDDWLLSFGMKKYVDNETDNNVAGLVDKELQNVITATSIQDFLDKFESSVQSTNQSKIIVQAVNNKNLSFDDYEIQSVYYEPSQMRDDGKSDGIECVKFYWHRKDCASCNVEYCELFTLRLSFIKNGIDMVGVTKGYTQTETDNFYEKEVNNNKTSYVYIIDNQYYCRFNINNELSDKEQIKEQLLTFCTEVDDIVKGDGLTGSFTDKEAAISIACAEFEKVQQNGIGKDCVLQGVYFDDDNDAWVVYFSPEPLIPGFAYHIAVSQQTGKIINMWPGE